MYCSLYTEHCNGTMVIPFIEEPESQAIAEKAQFHCQYTTADHIELRANTSSPSNFSTTSIPLPGGHSRYVLVIGAIPTYSGSVVICQAVFANNCPSQESEPAVLLIQGRYCNNTFFLG